MAGQGRRKTPTAILAAHGSKVATYERRDEPTVPNERIPEPPGLSAAARPFWAWAVECLYELGVLSKHSTQTIARYAEYLARWRRESDFLAKAGTDVRMVTNPDGSLEPKLLPQAKTVAVLGAELLRIEREFGFTPSSRPNLRGANQPVENDPLEAILKGRGRLN